MTCPAHVSSLGAVVYESPYAARDICVLCGARPLRDHDGRVGAWIAGGDPGPGTRDPANTSTSPSPAPRRLLNKPRGVVGVIGSG